MHSVLRTTRRPGSRRVSRIRAKRGKAADGGNIAALHSSRTSSSSVAAHARSNDATARAGAPPQSTDGCCAQAARHAGHTHDARASRSACGVGMCLKSTRNAASCARSTPAQHSSTMGDAMARDGGREDTNLKFGSEFPRFGSKRPPLAPPRCPVHFREWVHGGFSQVMCLTSSSPGVAAATASTPRISPGRRGRRRAFAIALLIT